jgi:hypothetical protein
LVWRWLPVRSQEKTRKPNVLGFLLWANISVYSMTLKQNTVGNLSSVCCLALYFSFRTLFRTSKIIAASCFCPVSRQILCSDVSMNSWLSEDLDWRVLCRKIACWFNTLCWNFEKRRHSLVAFLFRSRLARRTIIVS